MLVKKGPVTHDGLRDRSKLMSANISVFSHRLTPPPPPPSPREKMSGNVPPQDFPEIMSADILKFRRALDPCFGEQSLTVLGASGIVRRTYRVSGTYGR